MDIIDMTRDRESGLERTREADEQAINRVVGQAAVYQFPAIEGYTPYDDPHADQELIDRHLPRFLDVHSPDARRAMEHKLKREESEAELVCSSGWMGAVAAAGNGRPALATWTPGRSEYVAGELKYRPGHATLGYGFPDVDLATFDDGNSSGGGGDGEGSGGGGDRRRSKKRTFNGIELLPAIEVVSGEQPPPPPPDAAGGFGTPYDPPARHETNAPAAENVEVPRVDPPPADLETLSPQLQPVVEQPGVEVPALKPADLERANPEESSSEPSRVAGSNPEQLTTGQSAPGTVSPPAKTGLGWVDQFKLSQLAAEYSSIEGAGRLYRLATVAKWLEENPQASDTDLLTQFAPGLLRIRWVERRQAMVDYFRGAPALLEDVRRKQADYEAMESSGSLGDFTAWLAGQVTGGWKSPENWVGGAGKGASLLGRALWTGLKQTGVATASDAVTQWLLIKAGFQKEFDPVQTVTSAVASGAVSGIGKASADTVRVGVKKVLAPEDLAVWDRRGTVGRTPGKSSATGRAVIERMESEGKISNNPASERMFQASDGEWYPFKLGDMSHNTDAVSWWNLVGRNHGAKAPEVRKWMLDSNNYTIDRSSINRSAGAKLGRSGVRYLPPKK